MIIANPIYDTVFKFLLEDTDVAKQLLSAIIGEEIEELHPKPQEPTTISSKHLLTVFRVDFKAVVRTAAGERKKILIELQKSNVAFDIIRFRHYLGANNSQKDDVDGVQTSLPLLPIYFLGFPLSIKRPVLKIGRRYQDVSTGEVLDAKDDFIECLSHDCFVVQIGALPPETRTPLEKLLSVFNQKFVFDPSQKWLLKFPGDLSDEPLRPILNRLSKTAESESVKAQIQVEEEIDDSIDRLLREKEMIIQEAEERAKAAEKQAKTERLKNEALLEKIAELEKLVKR